MSHEQKFINFFVYDVQREKWFAALKISIMDYSFYQRIIKAFASILIQLVSAIRVSNKKKKSMLFELDTISPPISENIWTALGF